MNYKRGQATLFIIFGIVLVFAFFLTIFLIKPDTAIFKKTSANPLEEIKICIENSIKNYEKKFFDEKQFSEEFKIFYNYRGEKVPFSCYLTEFYYPCVQQSPLFIESIRKKMENKVSRDLSRCLLTMKESYENKGYSFEFDEYLFNLIFEEKEISYEFKSNIRVYKGETSFSISEIKGKQKSFLPALLRTAESINNYESSFCEFDFIVWQALNRNVKIDRFRGGDQTKIYILKSSENPKEEIKFAIRTCVMPAGI